MAKYYKRSKKWYKRRKKWAKKRRKDYRSWWWGLGRGRKGYKKTKKYDGGISKVLAQIYQKIGRKKGSKTKKAYKIYVKERLKPKLKEFADKIKRDIDEVKEVKYLWKYGPYGYKAGDKVKKSMKKDSWYYNFVHHIVPGMRPNSLDEWLQAAELVPTKVAVPKAASVASTAPLSQAIQKILANIGVADVTVPVQSAPPGQPEKMQVDLV